MLTKIYVFEHTTILTNFNYITEVGISDLKLTRNSQNFQHFYQLMFPLRFLNDVMCSYRGREYVTIKLQLNGQEYQLDFA